MDRYIKLFYLRTPCHSSGHTDLPSLTPFLVITFFVPIVTPSRPPSRGLVTPSGLVTPRTLGLNREVEKIIYFVLR